MKGAATVAGTILWCAAAVSLTDAQSPKAIQEHGTAMIRDAEEMVAHGGMGDGRAIVHHCAELSKHAEAIMAILPLSDEHGQQARPLLQEAITQCRRVAEMGERVDPGASLNPATKARAAAREAMKHLSAIKESGA
ncbi:MAG TPA: small metal-binding protein SmbP [Nitrospira sp.]|nr:small metal-binding protein SmbP [Nitrospira sp.]